VIGLIATTETDKREYDDSVRFRVEQPAGNPFMTTEATVIGKDSSDLNPYVIAQAVTHDSWESITALRAEAVAQAWHYVERYPASPRACTNLGLALMNSGHPDKAAVAFKRALELEPHHYLARINLVRAHIAQNMLNDAEELCVHLAQERVDDPNPLMSLADIATRRGNLDEAARLWQQAIALKQETTVYARLHLAMVLLSLRRYREAISQLKIATRLDVRSAVLHHGLGIAYALAGDTGRASRAFKAALALAPQMPEAIHGLCGILLMEGKSSAAQPVLKEYLKDVRNDAVAYDLLAWAYFQQAGFRESRSQLFRALRALEEASSETIEIHRARILNNLGVCDWLLQERDEANRWFRRAIEAHPNTPLPYHNLVRLILWSQPREAETLLLDCTQQFPEDVETQTLLASALEIQGQYEEAIKTLQRVVGKGKASHETLITLAGLLTDCRHNPAAALPLLDEVRRLAPNDTLAANNRAYTYLILGDITAARDILASVPDHEVSGVSAIVLPATRGLLALREGDFERARGGYAKAEQVAKELGQTVAIPMIRHKMHLEFARAYKGMGALAKARQEVREGMSTPGESRYRRDLKTLAVELSAVQA